MLKRGFLATILAQLSGRVGSMLANMLMLAIVARLLDRTAFGEVMFALTFVSILVQVADFGTNAALARLVVEHRERGGAFWGNFLIVRLQLSIVAMLFGLIAALFFGNVASGLLLVGVATIPLAGSRFFDPVYQVYGRPWLSTSTLAVYSVSLVALTAGAAWLTGNQVAFLLAYAAANGVYCVVAWRAAGTCVRPDWRRDPALRRDVWRIAVPIGIAALFTTLNSRASVMIIGHYRDFEEVGLFAGAARILDLGVAAATMALGPLVPIFSSCADDRGRLKGAYLEILRLVLLVLVPMIISSPLWAAPLVHLLFGAKYLAAAPAVVVLSGVGGLVMLCLLNSYMLLVLRQVRFGIWLSGSAALMSVALNLWFVPTHGFLASAWIAFLAEALMCAMTFVLLALEFGSIFEGVALLRLLLAAAVALPVMHGGWTNSPWLALVAGILAYGLAAALGGMLRADWARLKVLRHDAFEENN